MLLIADVEIIVAKRQQLGILGALQTQGPHRDKLPIVQVTELF